MKADLPSLLQLFPARRAFVTGATGLLGNNLVRLLLQEGFTVRALARSRAKAEQQFGRLPGLEIIEGDMADVAGFAKSLAGCEVIFHTAAHFRSAYQGGNHWARLHRINVVGTRDLLAAAWAAGLRRFVHTSSIAVLHGAPGAEIDETMTRPEAEADDYYRSKILADAEVTAFLHTHPEMWACCVLPGWMHGPGDLGPTSAGQMVLDFLQQKLPGVIPGSFSIVDARDVAACQLSAALRGRRGERYLAAGRHCTMADLATLLEQVSGVPAPRRRIPLFALRALGLASEGIARLTGKPALLSWATVKLLASEQDRSHFNHRKSIAELGLELRPLTETLRDEIDWYRQHDWLSVPLAKSGGTTPKSLAHPA